MYVQNEKSTGLDSLPTLATDDVVIVGDVSDSGRAKKTTLTEFIQNIANNIGNIFNGLISVVHDTTLTGDGTTGNPLSVVDSGDSGGGSGTSWGFPDNPNGVGVITIAASVDSGTPYIVPAGKRLYIYSVTNANFNFRVDGKIIAISHWQDTNAPSISLGNPIVVEAGEVVDTDSGNNVDFVGYLIDAPVGTISALTIPVDGTGTTYVVPTGKIFVLLNAFTDSSDYLVVTPNGGSQVKIGAQIDGTGWSLKTPMFFHEGDEIEMLTNGSNGTLNGYLTNVGTNFGSGVRGVDTNGITTKVTSDASVVQLIPHGLGTVPAKIRLTFMAPIGSSDGVYNATLVYNGITVSVVGFAFINGLMRDMSDVDIKLYGPTSGNQTEFQTGVVTFDETNIIITWTKTNSPTGTVNILWEAKTGGGTINGALYTVNADENDFGWQTNVMLPGSEGWSLPTTQFANGVEIDAGITVSTTNGLLGYNSTSPGADLFLFDIPVGKKIRMKCTVIAFCSSSSNLVGFGFANVVTNFYSKTNSVDNRIQFLFDDTNAYAITSNTSTNTNTTATGVVVGRNSPNICEIVWTVGTDVKFYINGALVATHTTSIPTSSTLVKIFMGGNGAGTATCWCSEVTISQSI